MLNRFINGENARRKGIYREALNLTREGWYVLASHIPGFHPPPEIEGYVPDIYAVRDDRTLILDFVTDGSPSGEAYQAHSAYSLNDPGTEYYCWVVDSAGCRSVEYA